MPFSIHDVLEALSEASLLRLCDHWARVSGATAQQTRDILARAYGPNLHRLIQDLTAEELVHALCRSWKLDEARTYSFSGLGEAARVELAELARCHFIEGWLPARSGERPPCAGAFKAVFDRMTGSRELVDRRQGGALH